jgi:mRNA-degrading endonuclease toxin of MazEF toxin-antitoxin module
VVVQEDVFNHSRIATVVVCALTSNLHRANEPGNVLLEVGEGNLPEQSVVVVSQISSVDKALLGPRMARCPRRGWIRSSTARGSSRRRSSDGSDAPRV